MFKASTISIHALGSFWFARAKYAEILPPTDFIVDNHIGNTLNYSYRQKKLRGWKGWKTRTYNANRIDPGLDAYRLGAIHFRDGINQPKGRNDVKDEIISVTTRSRGGLFGIFFSDNYNGTNVKMINGFNPKIGMAPKKWNRKKGHSPSKSTTALFNRGYEIYKKGFNESKVPFLISNKSASQKSFSNFKVMNKTVKLEGSNRSKTYYTDNFEDLKKYWAASSFE